jgi:exosortase
MVSSSAPDESVPSGRPFWTGDNFYAWGAVLGSCIILFGLIPYCPSYFAGKFTLFELFTNTFWPDLVTQVSGFFSARPKESLSGEVTAGEWTYCGLVPLIAAWLVWRMRSKLRLIPAKGETAGYVVLSAGLLLYAAGFLMENYYIGIASTELIYAGLIVLFLGRPAMKLLIFPWAFLLFMWPYAFMEDVALELRLTMSTMSHHALQLIGVDNLLHGTAIVSPPNAAHSFAIDIADPCSGIRSLFALVMIAAVYAFISFDSLWKQAVIVALAVPMVIAGNLVRIIALTLATIHYGEAFSLGTNAQPSWFHEGAGYLVYMINFCGLLLVGECLDRFKPTRKEPDHA